MNRKTIVTYIVFFSIAAISVSPWVLNELYYVKIPRDGDVSVEATQLLVAQATKNFPSHPLIEKWLKGKKIEYVYVDGHKENFNDSSVAVRSGIPTMNIGSIIYAEIPGAERGIIAKWDIQIVFFFDKKGNLLKYTVEKTSTGF